jgi:hypothetical protein
MDERVARLETPEECEQFAVNVADRMPELTLAARRRAVELRAALHGATSDAEREALQAVYAYERVLSEKHGKTVRAVRTWQMIKRHGIIKAVERAVDRPDETIGYTALIEMGMSDFAFEAVVCRHPSVFSADALKRSQERLKKWDNVAETEQPPA